MVFSSVLLLVITMGVGQTLQQQYNVYGQDVKQSIQEITTHVNEAMQSYAKAMGVKYVEGEHTLADLNLTAIESAKGPAAEKLVNPQEYQTARDHLSTAQLMFVGLIPEIKNTYSEDIIQAQSGLLMLQNLLNYRSPYNVVEDIGFGVVLAHLDNISK